MDFQLNPLHRGGFLFEGGGHVIQFGVPPETIKDTLTMPQGVPILYVVPKDFFHIDRGISFADVEFPIYYNFFLKQRKTKIILQKERIQDLKSAFVEAIFGPKTFQLESEFFSKKETMPDLQKESFHFQGNMTLEDLVEFLPLEEGKIELGDLKIQMNGNGDFHLFHQNQELYKISGTFRSKSPELETEISKEFIAPLLGMTCLGPSHGFDPTESTSGFILWLNHRGIMIDPPVDSTLWMRKWNINPKHIDSIILTHCHSDHDAGTFQKILSEGKINIYTTQTIMGSFLRKYSHLTRISKEEILKMFQFHPVPMGKEFLIHQGKFRFFYSLHSIPAIGFHVDYREKTIAYSADHFNHPPSIEKLYQDGVISQGRKEDLLQFPWDSDLIYHESGIPPIHTPIEYLNSLPESIQKKTVVYHIAQKDFPETTHLERARFGIKHSKTLKVPTYIYDSACDVLNLLEKVEYFNSFTLSKISDLMSILQTASFTKGEQIVEKGSLGDKFYIIVSGEIRVEDLGGENEKIYGQYNTFGEASLILDEPRKASIMAHTNVELLYIEKEAFLKTIQDTSLEERLKKLSQSRDIETWNTLMNSPTFKNTTPFQKTAFETMLLNYNGEKDEVILSEGQKVYRMYLIHHGKVLASNKKDADSKILERGEWVGNILDLEKQRPSQKSYTCLERSTLYQVNRRDMLEYVQNFPNVYMNLLYSSSH